MTTHTALSPGLASIVLHGGVAVQVANPIAAAAGGYIVNPLDPIDQGIHIAEPLYVNIVVPPQLISGNTLTNVELEPGGTFIIPPGTNVWVNAATSGHKFTAVLCAPYEIQYPPSPVPGGPGTQTSALGGAGGPFPPPGVTGLTDVIPSYLYQEYSDDDDLQEFVAAQNTMQQNYVDTFNALNLPIYTGHPSLVSKTLLDWVGQGLYGMARPAIGIGAPLQVGPLNTWGCNMPGHSMDIIYEYFKQPYRDSLPTMINELAQLTIGDVVITDDDTYRRILSWHFFKGDGKYFNTRWLKRRVWRFCYGWNGVSPDFAADPETGTPHYDEEHGAFADADDAFIGNTSQISVSIGANRNVTIRFVLGIRTITGGEMLNAFGCNGFGPYFGAPLPNHAVIALNEMRSTYQPLPPIPFMYVFKSAVDTGALELPYQYNYSVHVG
jgi:hypothetical protein